MNPNQTLWVRISQNQNVIEQQETSGLDEVVELIIESFAARRTPSNRRVGFVIEIDNQPLVQSMLSREQQLEQQMLSQSLGNKDEVIYPPDVTLRECEEAWASPEGQQMFLFQKPENRIGVEPSALARIKAEYESKFPRVAPHGPLWT